MRFLRAKYLLIKYSSKDLEITDDIKNSVCNFAEVCLQKPLKEYIIKPIKNKSYFGLEIYQENLIKGTNLQMGFFPYAI